MGLWWSQGVGLFLMSEVPLYKQRYGAGATAVRFRRSSALSTSPAGRETIFIRLTTSDRKLKAPREGSK